MARKKEYPGGFRLTLATARRLAAQEFGTAKGLEPDRGTCLEGFFTMQMGNMGVSISPDLGMSGCIVVRAGLCTASHTCIGYFNRETLEPDYDVMDKYEQKGKRKALETWVGDRCGTAIRSSSVTKSTRKGASGAGSLPVSWGFQWLNMPVRPESLARTERSIFKVDPPEGEGWQLWETTTEGAPISVIASDKM